MQHAQIVNGKIDALSDTPFSQNSVEVPDNAELDGAWDGTTYTVPSTTNLEKARAVTITRKQLRVQLILEGETETFITDIINAMAPGTDKQTAIVLWEDTVNYHRDHPLIVQLVPATGYSTAEIDTMWVAASLLDA